MHVHSNAELTWVSLNVRKRFVSFFKIQTKALGNRSDTCWPQSYERFTSLYLPSFYLYLPGNFTKISYKSKRLVYTSELVQVSLQIKLETFWPKNLT